MKKKRIFKNILVGVKLNRTKVSLKDLYVHVLLQMGVFLIKKGNYKRNKVKINHHDYSF